MKKFLIYVNNEREALKIAKIFRFEFTGFTGVDKTNFSCANNKQGYMVLLIDDCNFIYIVYDRNVILNSIINEKDFDSRCIYSNVHNTALLNNYCSFENADSILKCIKHDLKKYIFKESVDLQSLIKDVKFNPPATIVFWSDGTKTVAKSSEFDDYDPEKGFMLCVMKYLLKPQLTEDKKLRSYYKTITDYTDKFGKFDKDKYDAKIWTEGYIKLLFNSRLDEEPNSTYEKDIDTEVKVNARKNLHSIVNNIRDDKFNFIRFHGERPNDIKVEEIKSVYVELDETIKNISIIQFCNMQILEVILANIYHLTTSEIFLYHNNDCDEFIICSNNTAIIMFKGLLTEDYFVSLLDNVRRGDDILIEDARYFTEYPYFQKYICDILTRIVDIKGEQ